VLLLRQSWFSEIRQSGAELGEALACVSQGQLTHGEFYPCDVFIFTDLTRPTERRMALGNRMRTLDMPIGSA
jgi:hypothetical protein